MPVLHSPQPPTHPTIANQTNQHLGEALGLALTGAPKTAATGMDPTWGELGPRTTGKPRITAASDGQPTAQVSDRFRAFPQVLRSPGLSLARRKPGPVLKRLQQSFGPQTSPRPRLG
jgi:hypothetical protein